MSIDKHLEKVGVTLEPDNTLPQGQRTKKHVSRLIQAVRAAESSFRDEIEDCNHQCREAESRCNKLLAENADLRTQLQKYKLKERMEAIDALSVADRQMLLTAE